MENFWAKEAGSVSAVVKETSVSLTFALSMENQGVSARGADEIAQPRGIDLLGLRVEW